MPLTPFHPLIEQWFAAQYAAPTEPQQLGWPYIGDGCHTLISAPTGSGKTLTAFLAVIDRLLKESLAGTLTEDGVRVVYVSPLRALSNDMHRNLSEPLAAISELQQEQFPGTEPIRVGLRTGDTTQAERAKIIRKPPHILVTTPESLYLMLTSPRGRERLKTTETLIVDEIHALIRDKRGSHLALSVERLEALCGKPLQRIGLSATQKPLSRVADFLMGREGGHDCKIVNVGHARQLDLDIEIPPSELNAVCTHEQWAEVYQRLIELIESHRSTVIFVNTRRMAERLTHQLTERLGEELVSSHHGSLSAKFRHRTEQRLKRGELKAVVATASLELGIDVGYIDLVVQLGSPRSIATFLQRIGRSGHSLGLIPKGRLIALTRDELMECAALIRGVKCGVLDAVVIPEEPIDVLAQQIVAEVANQEWETDRLYDLFHRSWPYRHLTREKFDRVVDMLSEGLTPRAGRQLTFLHHDQVAGRLRARPSARFSAISNAGAIPETGQYRVVAEPEQTVVGSVDEDFAVESMAGDVFLLGNTSWRIMYVRGGDVVVADARGAAPSIPFWLGESPGRTIELSQEVSRLRVDLEARLSDLDQAVAWLQQECGLSISAAEQLAHYAAAQQASIGLLPTRERVVFERFFDESGGMQLVIHAPYGAAINRGWGYALRKRFCRSFNFELQATADDDGIILSLGPQHSFPIEELFPILNRNNAQDLLEQALLDQPIFHVRWRWNATRALLVLRSKHGKKIPPALQRFRAEDLLTSVFPIITACRENVTGDIELPDHPLAQQTMYDCLHEPCDIDGLHEVLEAIERGEVTLIARDTREPSPFSYELLNSNPYAFLDGGEIQERRARAVSTRRSLQVDDVRDLGWLDPAAIEQVRQEATPLIRNADELHDVLLSRILLPNAELTAPEREFMTELVASGRATKLQPQQMWTATERLPAALAVFPEGRAEPTVAVPPRVRTEWSKSEAIQTLLRGFMETCGPITATTIAEWMSLPLNLIHANLEALEAEGHVLRGHYSKPDPTWKAETADDDEQHESVETAVKETEAQPPLEKEWCHRRLLARIHRLTMDGLRREIEPVPVDVYLRCLFRLHGVSQGYKRAGTNGLFEVVGMLQGWDVPLICWERDILPARLENYQPQWLDELCMTGEIGWGRLFPPTLAADRSKPVANLTRIVPVSLFLRNDVDWLLGGHAPVDPGPLSGPAQDILEALEQRGAQFANDLLRSLQILPTHMAEALGELISRGLVTADGFGGLRLFLQESQSAITGRNRRRHVNLVRRRTTPTAAGRWSIWRRSPGLPATTPEETADQQYDLSIQNIDAWAGQLLRRWGVVFRDLLQREEGAPRWWELLQVYRRWEARGEIRGGRFIKGVAGEQFASAEAVQLLRRCKETATDDDWVVLSAADPLNIVGIVTKHPRVPSTASNQLVFRNGQPVAGVFNGELTIFDDVSKETRMAIFKRYQPLGQPPSKAETSPTVEAVDLKRRVKG
ncbi:MAG: DEAD/DEAH box helicase [Planctomycetaceae bacterium]